MCGKRVSGAARSRAHHSTVAGLARCDAARSARVTSVHDCPVPLGVSAHCACARNERGVQVVEVHEH